MALADQLLQDMKTAMKSGDKITLETIRMVRSQIKNVEVQKGETLTDEDIFQVLTKEAKRRKESIEMYKEGGRDDLAENESKELNVIQSYLPEALSEDELLAIIADAIEKTGARGMSDMGKVMGAVMPQTKGRADGKMIQNLVRQKLG